MRASGSLRISGALGAILFHALIPSARAGEAAIRIADFDKNGNGQLDLDEYRALQELAAKTFGLPMTSAEVEARSKKIAVAKFLDRNGQLPDERVPALVLATQSASVYRLDANLDGKLDAADLPLQQAFVEAAVDPLFGTLNPRIEDVRRRLKGRGDSSESSVREVLTELGILTGDQPTNPWGFVRLREDANIDLDAIGSLQKARPATISFSHNYRDNGRQVTNIKAALIAPIPARHLRVRTDAITTTSAYYLPSATWEKVNGTARDDVDLISGSFGLGASWRRDRPVPFVQQLVGTFNFYYDRERSSQLVREEVIYTPVYSRWAIGGFKPVIGGLPFDARLDVRFNTSTTQVVDAGTNARLKDQDDTWRVGGTLGLAVRPQGEHWNRISLLASFTYDSALSGSPQKTDLLDVGIKTQLDDAGRYSAEINYQDGEVTVIKVPTRRLLLKLGVKY